MYTLQNGPTIESPTNSHAIVYPFDIPIMKARTHAQECPLPILQYPLLSTRLQASLYLSTKFHQLMLSIRKSH